MAGFNGVKRAETSDRSSNPMLQDVAVGWLQKYRNEAPARVMSKVTDEEGHATSEVVRVGKGGDYASLDALVMDATNNLIEPWYQEDPDLVVIVGRQLLADKYFPIVNKEQDNSEMLAADVIISQKRIGNLPAVRVPYFPADAMLTMLKNQLHVALTRADKNELAQVALRQELENAAKREAQREKTITRLLNENEDFRRWYGADLPDAVRRLHQRPACTDASDCPQRLPESESLPDAGQ